MPCGPSRARCARASSIPRRSARSTSPRRSTRLTCRIRISSSGPAGRCGSRISSCGRSPTRSCGSPRSSGRTFRRSISTGPSPSIRAARAVSAGCEVGAVAISLRTTRPVTMLLQRVLSAAVLIPAVVWIVAGAPLWVLRGVVIALSAMAAWELGQLFQRAGRLARPWLGALCTAVVTGSFALTDPAGSGWLVMAGPGMPVVAALAATTAVLLATSMWSANPLASDVAVIGLSSLCYVGILMGHALLLQQLPDGHGLLLFLFGVTWAGETAAYAVGSLVGRHKLAPRISPGKP